MTIYQRNLQELVNAKFENEKPGDVVEFLFNIGVIDSTLAKVLVIREYVGQLIREGEAKLNAMWKATEIFACTYEYVRKCVYYYKDINITL